MPKTLLKIVFLLIAVTLFAAIFLSATVAYAGDCVGGDIGCDGGGAGGGDDTGGGGGGGDDTGGGDGGGFDPPSCPSPQAFPGAITVSALKLAPAYPLVIGQDESKRGADALWSVRIEPTAYVTWTAHAEYDEECGPVGAGMANCTRPNGFPGRFRDVQVGWTCEASTTYYPEGVNFANLEAHLSPAARDWILFGDLQIRYPGAYLHNPDMVFTGGSGWFTGNVYNFEYRQDHIPFADPGWWDLVLAGQTSGTPVTPPRNFGGVAGQLAVYLREIAIIR